MLDISVGKKEDLAKIVKIPTIESALFWGKLDKSKFLEILT
jgi:hypothetical protein